MKKDCGLVMHEFVHRDKNPTFNLNAVRLRPDFP